MRATACADRPRPARIHADRPAILRCVEPRFFPSATGSGRRGSRSHSPRHWPCRRSRPPPPRADSLPRQDIRHACRHAGQVAAHRQPRILRGTRLAPRCTATGGAAASSGSAAKARCAPRCPSSCPQVASATTPRARASPPGRPAPPARRGCAAAFRRAGPPGGARRQQQQRRPRPGSAARMLWEAEPARRPAPPAAPLRPRRPRHRARRLPPRHLQHRRAEGGADVMRVGGREPVGPGPQGDDDAPVPALRPRLREGIARQAGGGRVHLGEADRRRGAERPEPPRHFAQAAIEQGQALDRGAGHLDPAVAGDEAGEGHRLQHRLGAGRGGAGTEPFGARRIAGAAGAALPKAS